MRFVILDIYIHDDDDDDDDDDDYVCVCRIFFFFFVCDIICGSISKEKVKKSPKLQSPKS